MPNECEPKQVIGNIYYFPVEMRPTIENAQVHPLWHVCSYTDEMHMKFAGVLEENGKPRCDGCKKTWNLPYENLVMMGKMKDWR